MSEPNTVTTARAEAWLRSQRELNQLLDDAIREPVIIEAMAATGVSHAEMHAAIAENPIILRRLRAAVEAPYEKISVRGDRRAPFLRRAPEPIRIAAAVAGVALYFQLLVNAWQSMPLPFRAFSALGALATIVLMSWVAIEDTWLRTTATQAAEDRSDSAALLRDIVVPALTEFLEEHRTPSFSTTLEVREVQNLYDHDEQAPTIITAAGEQLRRILDRESTSDAIALAGHRGVGKSTAIHAISRGLYSDLDAPPTMQVVASAPSRYEARDFVLHLHAMLARRVIDVTGSMLGERTQRSLWPRVSISPKSIIMVVGPFCIALLLLWDTDVVRTVREFVADPARLWRPDYQLVTTIAATAVVVVLVGTIVVVLAMALVRLLARKVRHNQRRTALPSVVLLRGTAFEQLDRIRFLQTYTSGWSGKIGLPIGDMGPTRSHQLAEQQLTHPEVVESFRRFAERSAAVLSRHGEIERLVIAIDELDKIADASKAHEFINDIKGIFGVEGCLFLVAVSDDAVSAFERRGIPVRDAFDSAFSGMVRMDSFTIAESKRWISRRLLGVSEPFSYLCHCLSGGLPRDLRRTTIDLVDAVHETGKVDLRTVADLMVSRELDRKTHAFASAARQLDDTDELTGYLAELLLVTQNRGAAQLTAAAERLAPLSGSALPRVRWQSACFVLFCATILEVFTNDLDESGLGKGVELLGTARTQLAIDPHVAWTVVLDVRARYGLSVPGQGPA